MAYIVPPTTPIIPNPPTDHVTIYFYELPKTETLEIMSPPQSYKYIRKDYIEFSLFERQVAFLPLEHKAKLESPTPGTLDYFKGVALMIHKSYLPDGITYNPSADEKIIDEKIKKLLVRSAKSGFKPALEIVISCIRHGTNGFLHNTSKADTYQRVLNAIKNQDRAPLIEKLMLPPKLQPQATARSVPTPIKSIFFTRPKTNNPNPQPPTPQPKPIAVPVSQFKLPSFKAHPFTKIAKDNATQRDKTRIHELEEGYSKVRSEFETYVTQSNQRLIATLNYVKTLEEKLNIPTPTNNQMQLIDFSRPEVPQKRISADHASTSKRQKTSDINELIDHSVHLLD